MSNRHITFGELSKRGKNCQTSVWVFSLCFASICYIVETQEICKVAIYLTIRGTVRDGLERRAPLE
jgi:hypothetical protein